MTDAWIYRSLTLPDLCVIAACASADHAVADSGLVDGASTNWDAGTLGSDADAGPLDSGVTPADAPSEAADASDPVHGSSMPRFPADAGVIDITKAPYGADPTGQSDDTAAIERAIRDVMDQQNRFGIIYFPEGTYLVSRTLTWHGGTGPWGAYLSFVGDDPSNTVIRLRDGTFGTGDAGAVPQAVIKTGSFNGDAQSGSGNEAFGNYIEHLTVDVGSRNPNAIGIDYLANNDGAVKDVRIKTEDGSGKYGLAFTRGSGPDEIVGVTVEGFDYGVYLPASGTQTLEHIRLLHQNIAGIYNPSSAPTVFTVRDLASAQSAPGVPALQIVCPDNDYRTSLVTVLDSTLTNAAPGDNGPAIQSDHGRLLLRDIMTTGYVAALAGLGTTVTEFTTDKPLSLFSANPNPGSLHLTIEETPTVADGDLSTWANVQDPKFQGGAKAYTQVDNLPAIQAAIDSGATTVYFPTGNYTVNGTVHIRGRVQHILGMDSQLTLLDEINNQQGLNYCPRPS